MIHIFDRWKTGLEKTRKQTFSRIADLLGATEITAETWEDLEALLFQADVGTGTTQSILDSLRATARSEFLTSAAALREHLHNALVQRLAPPPALDLDRFHPAVVLIVGVNGSGKTTTIAKLGKLFETHGKKVLLAAADTYRAAAVDQLQVWGERLNLAVIAGQHGGDPGAVTYDAIQAAIARNIDLLLVDTAGRLHTRYNLMEELKKVVRVAGKALPGAPHSTWLVVDATTGQNALQQARAFKDAVNVTGVILAKLDSTARGGMAFAIQRELGLPILYAGLGEQPEDLQPFDRDAFVAGIFSNP
ncbi:MAG: signal recognition particle-docking protein FtsY [Anaerolineaceae bacterium]|nr:signal recognition particle-docking protein FtsY [Anaerolineaceae bacterium]